MKGTPGIFLVQENLLLSFPVLLVKALCQNLI